MVLEPTLTLDRPLVRGKVDALQPRLRRNLEYIGQLVALRAWYRGVRLARAPAGDHELRTVLLAAHTLLGTCIDERVERLRAFVGERGGAMPSLVLDGEPPPCPLPIELPAELPIELPAAPSASGDHLAWVQGLSPSQVEAGVAWLTEVATQAATQALGADA
jgi:hypothetical protein